MSTLKMDFSILSFTVGKGVIPGLHLFTFTKGDGNTEATFAESGLCYGIVAGVLSKNILIGIATFIVLNLIALWIYSVKSKKINQKHEPSFVTSRHPDPLAKREVFYEPPKVDSKEEILAKKVKADNFVIDLIREITSNNVHRVYDNEKLLSAINKYKSGNITVQDVINLYDIVMNHCDTYGRTPELVNLATACQLSLRSDFYKVH